MVHLEQEILYHEGHAPPDMPIPVLVHFDNYTGPALFNSQPNCVQIPPHNFEWISNGQHLSRQQLPLALHYAIVIHKNHGQTLPKAVVDISQSEHAAGTTFVAISRLKQLLSYPMYAIWTVGINFSNTPPTCETSRRKITWTSISTP